jgi:hypothetical protein
MLKGRDLNTEKYYSKENVEKLREIYLTKIYPKLWANASQYNTEEIKTIKTMLQERDDTIRQLQAKVDDLTASGLTREDIREMIEEYSTVWPPKSGPYSSEKVKELESKTSDQ